MYKHRQGCDSVVNLQTFFRSKLDQFNCCRVFTKSLVHIEKHGIELKREFHRTLTLWNKPLQVLAHLPQKQIHRHN